MNLIFFENRALSIHDGEMLLFCALDAYTTVYEHQVLLSTSASFENKTEQSKEKTTVKTLIFCTLSAVLFWLRGKSLWISSFIYSPGWIPCSLFNALSTALT